MILELRSLLRNLLLYRPVALRLDLLQLAVNEYEGSLRILVTQLIGGPLMLICSAVTLAMVLARATLLAVLRAIFQLHDLRGCVLESFRGVLRDQRRPMLDHDLPFLLQLLCYATGRILILNSVNF